MINKKTPNGLSSFQIVDYSSQSKNEVNNLTENNHDDLNLDSNENCLLPSYNTDTLYSHQVVSRPKKAKGELKLEARFTTSTNYINCEIPSLNSKFQSVCDELRSINIPKFETMKTLQKRINYLQIEVPLKDVIIKIIIKILDSGTNCNSQDKDDSFVHCR